LAAQNEMFFHTGSNTFGKKTPLLQVAPERGGSDMMMSVTPAGVTKNKGLWNTRVPMLLGK